MLDSLHIKNFRCFEDLTIPSLGRVNLIVGKNNSGKSTLLEAVYTYAKKGNIQTLLDILSDRDETAYFSNNSERRDTFQDLQNIFTGRKFSQIDEENKNVIYIGNKDQSLKVEVAYLRYIEETKHNTKGLLNFSPAEKKFINHSEEILIHSPIFEALAIFPDELEDILLYEATNFESQASLKRNSKEYSCSFVATQLFQVNDLAELWDDILLNSMDIEARNFLSIIDSRFSNLFFIKKPGFGHQRIAVVKYSNEKKAIPLKSFGEGMSRLLQIFLHSFKARGGYLMIDEFENGLHYSIQEEVWEKLFKLAKELDIQVFVTTHSQDTIKAFSKIALQSEEEGRLISLGRNEREIDKGKITAITYNEDDIKLIAETGMEVR
ncbi:AAA family ATPase [Thiothrix unzii]|uniref:AAA family ATPase n=1 Tax=Thiothrix unzii TaxID=111769 RepID=A0A975IIE5_9GAMM|nr:ATP-binding protein [Thiothrix unzii]QTR55131.1 AAA family ATPase [Thiothrix unzii]